MENQAEHKWELGLSSSCVQTVTVDIVPNIWSDYIWVIATIVVPFRRFRVAHFIGYPRMDHDVDILDFVNPLTLWDLGNLRGFLQIFGPVSGNPSIKW